MLVWGSEAAGRVTMSEGGRRSCLMLLLLLFFSHLDFWPQSPDFRVFKGVSCRLSAVI